MSTKEVEGAHQEGLPWTIVGRFPTFAKANEMREELGEDQDLHVKVRWARRRDDFVVKTRADPAIAAAEELAKKREEKKRRQAKLNKKRRKK